MDIIKFSRGIRDYIQGFLEVSRIQTPRYSFVIEKFDITYQGVSIKTKIYLDFVTSCVNRLKEEHA